MNIKQYWAFHSKQTYQKHIEAHTFSVSNQMSISHFGIIHVADWSTELLLLLWVFKNNSLKVMTLKGFLFWHYNINHFTWKWSTLVKPSECCSAPINSSFWGPHHIFMVVSWQLFFSSWPHSMTRQEEPNSSQGSGSMFLER